jgi:hypothetical protein
MRLQKNRLRREATQLKVLLLGVGVVRVLFTHMGFSRHFGLFFFLLFKCQQKQGLASRFVSHAYHLVTYIFIYLLSQACTRLKYLFGASFVACYLYC